MKKLSLIILLVIIAFGQKAWAQQTWTEVGTATQLNNAGATLTMNGGTSL